MSEITNAPAPTGTPAGAPTAAPAPAAIDPAQLALPGATEPAPAPAASPAPAPAASTPAPSDVSYEPTGDVGLDLALKFVGDRGIDAAHPAMTAARTGDFHLLRATLATMGEKALGFEPMIALAEQAYAQSTESAEARQAADLAVVHGVAGGEESWKAVREWAGKEATPDEKAAINAQLAQGGMAAKMAAVYLTSLYARVHGAEGAPQGKSALAPGASGAPSVGALSPAEYAAAVKELARTSRVPLNENPEYAALRSRRSAWRGQ